ncbi:glycosyltransferase [Anaerobranca gottschalkii]|uniref:Glycosyltransferase involved in cell wall bisynthesis n=1 Tax=Anaerobranca gottschalkii DSM 13577 TaxID=1120990 RepID=A0A1I0BCP3_9FIRM|nr:glycosyltransferase [Anaerobranca gottschalkii]SET04584.1 Glycosyltransferase involved in cell wall bisynthesis [Anaerobranca gottschalkii DSM 13577]
MKKIKMIVTNSFHPDIRVYKEAKYLTLKGFDVEILCWDRQNEFKNKEVEIIDSIKIKRFFPFAKYGTGYKQIIPFIKFIKECKNYLKNKEFDYLHCHDLDGIIVGYFCKSINCKLIFDMHEFYEVNGKKQKIRYIIRFLVNYFQSKSDNIIYVNEMQKKVVRNKNIKKLIYLPNYPDKYNYIECQKTESDKLRISYIGAVRQYNELKNLMDACKEMSDVEILIHGAGVAYESLKNIEKKYNNVRITGKYHFTQSAKLYSKTDLLYALYPTNSLQYRISYPVKFFEAIITKTPIIVNSGTVLENFIKEHDIGFAVDGSNFEEIRNLVMYINENRYILKQKIKNLEKIQYNYSWEEVVKNLDKIYT